MILGILLNFVATLFSIHVDRPLAIDGAWWAYRILDLGSTSFGLNKLRYLSAAFESPALILAGLVGSNDHTSLIIGVWEAGMVLHPYLSLLLCFYILQKGKKLHLFPIVALNLAVAGQITLAFAANQASEVLSIFWPVLCVLTCVNARSHRTFFGALAGTALLCTTHESAVFAFGILFAAAWRRRAHPAYLMMFALGAFECVARAMLGGYTTALMATNVARMATLFPFQVLTVIALLLLRLAALLQPGFQSLEKGGYAALAGLGLLFTFMAPVPWEEMLFNGRFLAIDLGLALGWYFVLSAEKSFPTAPAFLLPLNLLVAAALLFSARSDASASLDWREGTRNLASIAKSKGPGCHVIPSKEFKESLGKHGIMSAYLAPLSILLQKNRRIEHVLFTGTPWRTPPEQLCPNFVSKGILSMFHDIRVFPSRYFTKDF